MLPIDDDRIDEAARALTEGAPGTDLRARVVARIEQTHTRRVPARAWLLATAAVAAVAVAAIVYRPQPPVTTSPEAARSAAAALAVPAPVPQVAVETVVVSELEPEMLVIPLIEVAELPRTNPMVVDELSVEPILMSAIDLPVSDTVNRRD